MDGILLVYKPPGMTSMDVLRDLKRAYGVNSKGKGKGKKLKIGHGGTLDPAAEGLLVIALGSYTKRLSEYLADDKVYSTVVNLSHFTTTDDAEGDIEDEEFKIDKIPNDDDIKEVVSSMIGEIEQVPSKFSAIKIKGKRAYELAREGKEVDMKSRKITIHSIDILDYSFPDLSLRVSCSKGTYIRTLGRDIGTKLKTGGHLTKLVREKSGSFQLKNAISLDDAKEKMCDGSIVDLLIH